MTLSSGGRESRKRHWSLELFLFVPTHKLLLGHFLEFCLDLFGLWTSPRASVGQKAEDDSLARIHSVRVRDLIQTHHRFEVRFGSEVDVLPVLPDLLGNLIERSSLGTGKPVQLLKRRLYSKGQSPEF